MSVWSDIYKRSNGTQVRKENIFKCDVNVVEQGGGRKPPKWLVVPDDIRIQPFAVCLQSIDNGLLSFMPYAWSYKVGERNLAELYQMLDSFNKEFGDFTYHLDGELIEITDESQQMLDELTKRVAKHNEEVSGKPFWSVDPFCRDSQP